MKKLIIPILLLSVVSCKPIKNPKLTHQEGDVVYLKPDSLKGYIKDKSTCGCLWDYNVVYLDKVGVRHEIEVKESEIYK